LEKIRALKVRDKKRPQIAEDRVPTFEEALAAIKDRVHMYLRFQSGRSRGRGEDDSGCGVSGQILVYDDVESITEWRRVAPELPLIVSPPANLKTVAELVRL
jgi:hypothetical protein